MFKPPEPLEENVCNNPFAAAMTAQIKDKKEAEATETFLGPSAEEKNRPELKEFAVQSNDEKNEPDTVKSERKIGRKRIFRNVAENDPQSVETKEHKPDSVPGVKQEPCCDQNCQESFDAEPEKEKLYLNQVFKADSLIESKNKMLQHLKSQRNLGLLTDKFSWRGFVYCNKVIASACGFSVYLVEEVLRRHSEGIEKFTHGNSGINKFSLPATKFKVWMRGFISRYGK